MEWYPILKGSQWKNMNHFQLCFDQLTSQLLSCNTLPGEESKTNHTCTSNGPSNTLTDTQNSGYAVADDQRLAATCTYGEALKNPTNWCSENRGLRLNGNGVCPCTCTQAITAIESARAIANFILSVTAFVLAARATTMPFSLAFLFYTRSALARHILAVPKFCPVT